MIEETGQTSIDTQTAIEVPHEIEHRFAADREHLPNGWDSSEPILISQSYILNEGLAKGPRIRKEEFTDGSVKCTLTYKGEGDVDRTENEQIIDEKIYESLKANGIIGQEVVKDRYIFIWENVKYFIDIFRNPPHVTGKILVEVEFKSREDADNFVSPNWLAKRVTESISNRKISKGTPIPDPIYS